MLGVLLIGAMKAGSTSLHALLAQHPKLYMCPNKEPGFFSREERFAKGLDFYRSLFSGAAPGQIWGESSTCYSRYPHYGEVAERIYRHAPHARLIYLMRHPVDRMYSHYRHRMIERHGRDTGPVVSFEDALKEDSEYLDSSMYAFQIAKFLAFYPREQLLLLTTDELETEPVATALRAHEFLGIEPVPPADLEAENAFGKRFDANATKRRMRALRESSIGRLVQATLPGPVRSALGSTAKLAVKLTGARRRRSDFEGRINRLEPSTRRDLLARFVQPNRELESLLGRPVPHGWHS